MSTNNNNDEGLSDGGKLLAVVLFGWFIALIRWPVTTIIITIVVFIIASVCDHSTAQLWDS
jgi:multisubunit Na+/H+ antiporter MnhG subunit